MLGPRKDCICRLVSYYPSACPSVCSSAAISHRRIVSFGRCGPILNLLSYDVKLQENLEISKKREREPFCKITSPTWKF